jgi:hypothetical protein
MIGRGTVRRRTIGLRRRSIGARRRGSVRRILSANFKVWHGIVILSGLFLLAGSGLVLAGAGSGLFPQGNIRLASAWTNNSIDITGSNNPPQEVLNVGINVPSGKKGDVQASFSADLHHLASGSFAYCFGQFALDGAPAQNGSNVFKPGQQQLLGGAIATEPDALTVAMIGSMRNIPAGIHTVRAYVTSAFSGCELQAAALNVVVNLH